MRDKSLKRLISSVLLLLMIFTSGAGVLAQTSSTSLDKFVEDSHSYMLRTVDRPQVGSVGGEWAIIGLARSGLPVEEEYFKDYYRTVEDYVRSRDGVLDQVKYTEYSRTILALAAIGKDPRDVAGYNLITALGDFDKTIYQGLNGPVWALIALDSKNYPMPENGQAKTQATRDMYVDEILDRQLDDGGWSLIGGLSQESKSEASDPDMTGMVLQALAKYQDRPEVRLAVDQGVQRLSKMQNENGGYSSWGTENSESCVQVIVGLTELGISLDDPRFIKNGRGLVDNLLSYYRPGQGFLHIQAGGGSSQMASEQGFYALVAAKRAKLGSSSLYRMNDREDTKQIQDGLVKKGLVSKNKAVKYRPIVSEPLVFSDIRGASLHKNQLAIEDLTSRGIIAGKTRESFKPEESMTRAEFATIVVKALGLDLVEDNAFKDVKDSDWFSSYVATASRYGLVNGKTKDSFVPNGQISREEAASMIMRAGKLAGIELELNQAAIRDILAGFQDYVKVSAWAREGLAFAYNLEILDDSALNIDAKENVTRAEISQMIFNMLGKANLL